MSSIMALCPIPNRLMCVRFVRHLPGPIVQRLEYLSVEEKTGVRFPVGPPFTLPSSTLARTGVSRTSEVRAALTGSTI